MDWHFISNESEWAKSAIFDVRAKSDDSVNEALMKLSEGDAELEKQHMIRALMFDRFKLSAHKESKIREVYELRVAHDKPKIREVRPDMMSSEERSECQDHNGRCGRRSCGPEGCALVASSYSMSYFCLMLQAQIGLPVVDKTGLHGNYGFQLQSHVDKLNVVDDSSTFPSIFFAVEDQLGLKLVKTKSPVEFLVVDHIEKPTPN